MTTARKGMAQHGTARRGSARPGRARCGLARQITVGLAMAWFGLAWIGRRWQQPDAFAHRSVGLGGVGQASAPARLGRDRFGVVGTGKGWFPADYIACGVFRCESIVRFGEHGSGKAGSGLDWLGRAWHGRARQ